MKVLDLFNVDLMWALAIFASSPTHSFTQTGLLHFYYTQERPLGCLCLLLAHLTNLRQAKTCNVCLIFDQQNYLIHFFLLHN